MGEYLSKGLKALKETTDEIQEIRGTGLIQGIRVKKPAGEIINQALKEGLVIISASENVIRLVPPLIIEKEHVDEMLDILRNCM